RIEIIRGPGAALWGANAVNGVINIITRAAQDTQGGLWFAGAGNVERFAGGGRYGGFIDERTAYRISANAQSSDDSYVSNGSRATDGRQRAPAGRRIARSVDEHTHLMWQPDASAVGLDGGTSDAYAASTLGRWSHDYAANANVEAQLYYDRPYRNEITRARTA